MVDSTPVGSDELPPTGPELTPGAPSAPLPPAEPVVPASVEPPPPPSEPTPPLLEPAPQPSEPVPPTPPPPPRDQPNLTGGAVPPGPKIAGLSDNDRSMAALAYVLWFIGAAIILLSKDMKDRAYMRYHAIQGLGLSVVATVYSVAAIVLALVMSILGLCCCFWVLVVPGPIVTIYYAYRAYKGEYFTIPVLTNIMVNEGWLPK